MDMPVRVSNATIMIFLFALSARIPPNTESKIVGNVAIAKIPANIVAEPTASKTYIYNANFNMKLPNNELTCPKTSNVKFFMVVC